MALPTRLRFDTPHPDAVILVLLKMQIIRKLKKKRTLRVAWSREQQRRYKELVAELEEHGFTVRREELKRGHCWKAQSGMCRSMQEQLVFVDSRMSAEDQVAFLAAQVVDLLGPNRADFDSQVAGHVQTELLEAASSLG